MGYPTDCPQREKNGWTGDGHFAIETALYNYDGITVYEKWLADHRDEHSLMVYFPILFLQEAGDMVRIMDWIGQALSLLFHGTFYVLWRS